MRGWRQVGKAGRELLGSQGARVGATLGTKGGRHWSITSTGSIAVRDTPPQDCSVLGGGAGKLLQLVEDACKHCVIREVANSVLNVHCLAVQGAIEGENLRINGLEALDSEAEPQQSSNKTNSLPSGGWKQPQTASRKALGYSASSLVVNCHSPFRKVAP